jgi:5-methylthioadenosine/S-adenosylhomocysteine deaminase
MTVEAKPCDLLVTADLPSLAPLVDGYCVLVHSASGHDVDTVMADGDAIVARAQQVASTLWTRAGRKPLQ